LDPRRYREFAVSLGFSIFEWFFLWPGICYGQGAQYRLDTLLQEAMGSTRARQLVDHLDGLFIGVSVRDYLGFAGLGWVGEPAVASISRGVDGVTVCRQPPFILLFV
jgi:hypothetical protein